MKRYRILYTVHQDRKNRIMKGFYCFKTVLLSSVHHNIGRIKKLYAKIRMCNMYIFLFLIQDMMIMFPSCYDGCLIQRITGVWLFCFYSRVIKLLFFIVAKYNCSDTCMYKGMKNISLFFIIFQIFRIFIWNSFESHYILWTHVQIILILFYQTNGYSIMSSIVLQGEKWYN